MTDVIFLGAGLASVLAAYRLKQLQPDAKILLLERAETLGGDHTWSFHDDDVAASPWVRPFAAHHWDRQEVRFPDHRRARPRGYNSITAPHFAQLAHAALGDAIVTGVNAEPQGGGVALSDGRFLKAKCVLDGRGAQQRAELELGFQKFLGLEVRLEAPHGLTGPIIMDATIPQEDGYRFVYVLPFGPDHALIEDTYYSDGGDLSEDALEARVRAYAAAQGWRIKEVLRRERGVLPILLDGDVDAIWPLTPPPAIPIGMRGLFFHYVTGYSLPDAVRVAETIAAGPLDHDRVYERLRRLALERWARGGFYRLLNRMLFRAAPPAERYLVLQRFYRLPEGLIRRFYAGETTPLDQARILVGKPPVSFGRALVVAPPRWMRL